MGEKEYIERGALMEEINRIGGHNLCEWETIGVKALVERQPAADVVEVRHGEWKEHFSFGVWHYDCPFCDDGYSTKGREQYPPNYCQNCGAKMDGGKTE